MKQKKIHNAAELMQLVAEIGFLPLLNSGIHGFSADEMVDEDCRYVVFPDGGWDWPLWKWKGTIITEGNIVYGKFFAGKAGFISRDWWPDFCNYRRSVRPAPEDGSIEDAILLTLLEQGSMTTRDLRSACGFTGPKMRSLFDAYITRLQMACRIVTEDFVYPRDQHNHEYGWGWSLLTTPEQLYGRYACTSLNTPEESLEHMLNHLSTHLPKVNKDKILKILK